jgi:hypothetical protein
LVVKQDATELAQALQAAINQPAGRERAHRRDLRQGQPVLAASVTDRPDAM